MYVYNVYNSSRSIGDIHQSIITVFNTMCVL